jgi:phosphoribosylaminoimidazolecarboxamide formyltransferase/IMP cyclohydrolase
VQLQGKELSYNNINDTDAAYELVAEFDPATPACAIIKHANPCGVALGATLADAYKEALACDPLSAFGGVLAFNRTLDSETAEEIAKLFTEVIIAPDADDDARRILAAKKNLRLLIAGGPPDARAPGLTFRSVSGGFLVQTRDALTVTQDQLKVVTQRAPTEREMADMLFAFTVAKHVKSNTIVYAKDGATAGIGAGQMSRVDAARIAAAKAREAASNRRLGRAAHDRIGRRVGRVLSLPRRSDHRGRRGRHRRHPARRLGQRHRRHRVRERTRPRHGVHRHPPFPALNDHALE